MTKIVGKCRPLHQRNLTNEIIEALLQAQQWCTTSTGDWACFPAIVGLNINVYRNRMDTAVDYTYVFRMDAREAPFTADEATWLVGLLQRYLIVQRTWNGAGLNSLSARVSPLA